MLKRGFDLRNSGGRENGGQCTLDGRGLDVREPDLNFRVGNPELHSEAKLLSHLFVRVELLLTVHPHTPPLCGVKFIRTGA